MDNMGNKLEECDKILAAMKDSGLKDRVAAVQELLTRNASLIKGATRSTDYAVD